MEGTYPVSVECSNCGYRANDWLPRGKRVMDIPDRECPACGCCTLRTKRKERNVTEMIDIGSKIFDGIGLVDRFYIEPIHEPYIGRGFHFHGNIKCYDNPCSWC